MAPETVLLGIALLVGLYMAWNIGANDAANTMGTSVGSGALTLRKAVLIAIVLEFSGAYFFGAHVSDTVQKGIVKPEVFLQTPFHLVYGMIAALIAAGLWLHIASYFGWPVSTTHSIIGAIIGFGLVAGGPGSIHWNNVKYIFLCWLASPICGGMLAFTLFNILRRKIFYSLSPVEQTKKIVPWLVLALIFILSLTMMFRGLKNLDIDFNFGQALLISLAIGGAASLMSRFLVQRVKSPFIQSEKGFAADPQLLTNINKAEKYLNRSKRLAYGENYFQISDALEDIQNVSRSIQEKKTAEISHAEYHTVERVFVFLQIITASFMAFAHGANDVANAIAPLSAAITVLQTGVVSVKATISPWILAMGGIAIGIGLATWGWRIILTIGKKITKLTPSRGFSAEFGAAITVVIASRLGMPVSTTHTLVGAVLGVGLAGGIGAINLSTIRDIFAAWIITIPSGAIIAIIVYHGLHFAFG